MEKLPLTWADMGCSVRGMLRRSPGRLQRSDAVEGLSDLVLIQLGSLALELGCLWCLPLSDLLMLQEFQLAYLTAWGWASSSISLLVSLRQRGLSQRHLPSSDANRNRLQLNQNLACLILAPRELSPVLT